MKLLIDVGNSRCKWALVNTLGEITYAGVVDNVALAGFEFPEVCAAADAVWVANVAGSKLAYQLSLLLQKRSAPVLWLQSEASFQQLHNDYQAPHKLGIDRWAALVAAWHDDVQANAALVINAGTALTVDALLDNRFIGGVIAPGLRLQALAFGEHTDAVLVRDGQLQDFPSNTADAAYSGIVRGLLGVILAQCEALRQRAGKAPMCIITGGDAPTLLTYLNPMLQARGISLKHAPELVLRGIYLLGHAS